ncbi:MAG TPA: aspartyl protease family protein [Deinococcales bacterium]|nr:aspartyl protease family protein [Deinococcales bacterium]
MKLRLPLLPVAAALAVTAALAQTAPPAPATPRPPAVTSVAGTVSAIEARWRLADYPGAARLLKAVPAAQAADPRLQVFSARLDYLNGRVQSAEHKAAAAAAKLPRGSLDRAEALDLAGRSAFMRGDYPAAAPHARAQCDELAGSGLHETLDLLDPFCERAPAAFLSSFRAARTPQVLSPIHEAPMQPRRPTVSSVINGVQSAVLVDTGAESSAMLSRDADALGVRRTGFTTTIQGFTTDRVPVEWGVIDTLDLAGWRLRDVPVIILPNVFPPGALPAPLLLGLNELWPFRTTFDYPAGRFRLERSHGPLVPGKDRAVALVGPALRAPLALLGATVYATLDTGSDRLLLSQERLGQAGGRAPSFTGGQSGVSGVSGTLALRDAVVPEVRVLGRTLQNVPAGIAPRLPEGGGGIFGYDIVSKYRLVVDLQSEGMVLANP